MTTNQLTKEQVMVIHKMALHFTYTCLQGRLDRPDFLVTKLDINCEKLVCFKTSCSILEIAKWFHR